MIDESEMNKMTEKASQIRDLVAVNGKCAPDITHGLCVTGDGNMQNGLLEMGRYFYNSGMNKGMDIGKKRGLLIGSVSSAVILLLVGVAVKFKEEREFKRIKNAFQNNDADEKLADKDEIADYFDDSAENVEDIEENDVELEKVLKVKVVSTEV